MVSDAPPTDAPATPSGPPHPFTKVRLRFRKAGPLRLISHHDLMRVFERMLRRADLPFRRTQGFNPHPRLVFALSLPLGVVGCAEVAELELDEPLDPAAVQDRLARVAPPGLEVLAVRRIDPRAGALVRRLCYGLAVPADRVPGLADRLAALLATPACLVERIRPAPRRVDVRPFLSDLRLHERPDAAAFLEMELWLTSAGTARPAEVLGLLGLQDLLDAGAVLERTRLELHDEIPPEGGAT